MVTDVKRWRITTFDRWMDAIQDDGPDFEDIALESLRLATWMMEAAMEFPEWGRGFVQLAASDGPRAGEMREICQMFPVEMQDAAGGEKGS